MARTLPIGRNTKQDPGDTIRRNGLIASFGNKGIYGNYLDQLLFEAHGYEHILGTFDHVAADIATMTWNFTNSRFENKAGSEVVLDDWDRIAVIGMNTLTGNITIDNVDNLEIFHIGNTPGQSGSNPKFPMGDAGSGVPYKIFLGPNTNNCNLDILTDKTFVGLDRLNLTQIQKQYIANQGRGNYVRVNGEEIYNPSLAGDIIKRDTVPRNPYFLRMDGATWPYAADVSVNTQAWFRDLNIALGGLTYNGSTFIERTSRFSISQNTYLFRLNKANRFFTDISSLDTRIHQRTDPTGVNSTASAAFVSATNIVTLSSINNNIANGMRINGASAQGIPDGAAGTTIIKNFNFSANTAEMYNALTGAAVNATATTSGISVSFNNSGAAGGSHDADALQNITGTFEARKGQGNSANVGFVSTGAFTRTLNNGTLGITFATNPTEQNFDTMNFNASNVARTHNQTQPISGQIYHYYRT